MAAIAGRRAGLACNMSFGAQPTLPRPGPATLQVEVQLEREVLRCEMDNTRTTLQQQITAEVTKMRAASAVRLLTHAHRQPCCPATSVDHPISPVQAENAASTLAAQRPACRAPNPHLHAPSPLQAENAASALAAKTSNLQGKLAAAQRTAAATTAAVEAALATAVARLDADMGAARCGAVGTGLGRGPDGQGSEEMPSPQTTKTNKNELCFHSRLSLMLQPMLPPLGWLQAGCPAAPRCPVGGHGRRRGGQRGSCRAAARQLLCHAQGAHRPG
jgi:hypothetical protein